MLKKALQLSILINLFSWPIAGMADDTPYQVEIIVFSQISAAGIDSEEWPQVQDPNFNLGHVIELKQPLVTEPESIASEGNLDTETNTDTPTIPTDTEAAPTDTDDSAFTLLPEDKFILTKEENRLSKNPAYKVLLHIAWQQPASTLYSPKTFHLYGGLGYDGSSSQTAEITDESIPYNQLQQWQLNGLLTISLKRYFNLHFNLLLAQPTNQVERLSTTNYFSSVSSPFVYFRMLQNRRTRSSELNFIGHPLMGVLVKIEKLPEPKSNNITQG